MTTTIPTFILAAAEHYPRKPALLEKVDGRWQATTFAELHVQVARCAAGLQRLGVRSGDRVAILADNGPAWVVADLGAMAAGGVVVPVHASFSPALIQYVLHHSGARVLVVGNRPREKFLAITDEPPRLEHVVSLQGPLPATGTRKIRWHLWRELLGPAASTLPCSSTAATPASIVYTSGTTGLPKGVMLTHGNFVANARAALQQVPVTARDTLLSFLPLSHVLERTAGCFAPLSQGATIAYAERPATLRENLREIRPTILISVPRIFEKFHDAIWERVKVGPPWKRQLFTWALRQPPGRFPYRIADVLVLRKVRRPLGGRFRFTISGGAPLHPPLAKFFDRVGIMILEGYGLTETAPVVTVNTAARRRIGSVGQVLPGVEVRIAADKEILVRGPNVCAGYWQDPGGTNDLVDADGWLHTGDLGFFDPEGFLFIIGRRKEMLVTTGGKNVWPAVVENALNDDRLIAQSMVVGHGKPHVAALIVPTWGELEREATNRGWPNNRAALVNHPDVMALYRQRLAKATANLPDYEHVRRFVLISEEFSQERDELTPTLKLRRSVLERHYAKEIASLYEVPPPLKGR